ncbi:MAG: M20/M25/M40 family metallo-hydrolase [Desulfovibrionales bacterium]|nr:M20/M25/M40 family metallo-hydrolase [Desulfovibrionales bacterium]
MINRQRLAGEFLRLVQIDSPSRQEGAIAQYVRKIFESLDAGIIEDRAGPLIGSESGNLIVRIPGTRRDLPPLMFNAHLDTVEPGRGVKVIQENGTFKSDGRTILGADDKSGIAILIEAIRLLQEGEIAHCPLEFVFTVCEEIGLFGAKSLDYNLLQARMGYALDTSSTTRIISGAPEANSLCIKVQGLAAHAGLEPEKGINAIQIAGEALAAMRLGRIDHETTANIGLVRGGTARNIIPDYIDLEGEVRSHDRRKLADHTEHIRGCLEGAVSAYKERNRIAGDLPALRLDVTQEYPLMAIPDSHPVIVLAQEAGNNLGRRLTPEKSGGGSDANIFNAHGIATVILGTGMQSVHTTNEYIHLEDMVRTVQLVVEIISTYSRS